MIESRSQHVVSISLDAAGDDFAFDGTFCGQSFHIERVGTNGDLARALGLIREWDGRASAIGLAGGGWPKDILRQLGTESHTPVTRGQDLCRTASEWSLRHIQFTQGDNYFNNTRALFFSGRADRTLAGVMREYTGNLAFADGLLERRWPRVLQSLEGLRRYLGWFSARPLAAPVRWGGRLRRAAREAFTLVVPTDSFEVCLAGFTADELAGKTVITASADDARVAFLAARGVDVIIDPVPDVLGRAVSFDLLEAVMIATLNKPPGEVNHDDLLELICDQGLKPRVIYPGGTPTRTNRFAFVIHPLSQENLKNDRVIAWLADRTPGWFMDVMEWMAAYLPPYVYSEVSGIRSPKGVKAEGWLITVGGTPRQMLSHSPEFTYRRLLKAAKIAKGKGAQIMGLGAFTKVVGDAGVTVAKLADIPITTGNSYSASGALWAAGDAIRRLGLIQIESGKRIAAKGMVIGATGSIGAACCRLLAYAVEDLYMVDVRDARLLALREAIQREVPDIRIHVGTRPDKWLPEMDAIVTATSSAGKGVLDILKVKPGCVITDVARPLDLRPDEVAKRPDVLVIESGEIEVPGELRMRDIGLPQGVVFACMAETIVLALEGRYEVFTVGRNIEWERVREIYRLGLAHGMQLASISGVHGIFSEDDLAQVREAAMRARSASNHPDHSREGGPAPDLES